MQTSYKAILVGKQFDSWRNVPSDSLSCGSLLADFSCGIISTTANNCALN